MSPTSIVVTSIVGNAAIGSVDSVSGTKVFFRNQGCYCKSGSLCCICGQENIRFQMQKRLKFLQGWQSIYQWLHEVCTAKLLQTQIILGGPGVVVQIDESSFRHKPKVGRKPVQLSNE